MKSASSLPLTETVSPDDPAALASLVAECSARGTPVYPLGGQTSLDYGAAARRPGIGLSLGGLGKIIDYPARDMTVTVEAGITLGELARVLAAERQWLPVCGPRPDEATLGGLMATAWSDGRRYGWGTMRDYVIGVRAVDGRGMAFKGGGRVVKNVAGYDFCKLLTGSLGTLGVITEVTLKLKPIPERSSFVACAIQNLTMAESILARLATTAASPAAIELLIGPAWRGDEALEALGPADLGHLAVGLDGSAAEVEWMIGAITAELRPLGVERLATIDDRAAKHLWDRLRDFSAAPAAVSLKASVAPSRVCQWIATCRQADPRVNIEAHAGSGIVLARFADGMFAAENADPAAVEDMLGQLRCAAAGPVWVVSSTPAGEWTSERVWGPAAPAVAVMRKVKRQFDPHDILNPGRFVFGLD
jgi:glycolate oxidase FAD binding subunit